MPCQFEILNLNNLLFYFLKSIIDRNPYDSPIPVHFALSDSVSEARWQFCWTLDSFFVVFWMNNCKLCSSCNSEYLLIAVSSDVLLVINTCSVIKLVGLNKGISISIRVKRVFFSIKTFTWMMIWHLKNTTKNKYKHTETATARVSDKCPFYPILGFSFSWVCDLAQSDLEHTICSFGVNSGFSEILTFNICISFCNILFLRFTLFIFFIFVID